MARKTKAYRAAEKFVDENYGKLADGIIVNIMDLNKLSEMAIASILEGGDPSESLTAAIDTFAIVERV